MPKLRSLVAVLPLAAVALSAITACGSAPEPDPFGTEAVAKCEPGETPSCKCKNGQSGKRTCESGKLTKCDCSSGSAAEGGDPTATAARPVCTELASCTGLQPPPRFQPAQGLNIGLVAKDRLQILAELRAEVANGSPRARTLAAALDTRTPGEPILVTALRTALRDEPLLAETVARHVPELGFGDLAAYRTRFPISFTNLDVGKIDPLKQLRTQAAVDACAPSLRIRVAKITAHEDEDIITDDEIYCSISTTAPTFQELKITPKTPPLGNGESKEFNATESVFFGQGTPRDPGGDITVKYDCYEAEGNAGYAAMVGAAAKAAREYGQDVKEEDGENGWVSTGASFIGSIMPLLLALDGDDHLYSAEQKIPAAQHKELAKGATWSIKKNGKHFLSDWEWSLTMEAWGCSVNGSGTGTPPAPVK